MRSTKLIAVAALAGLLAAPVAAANMAASLSLSAAATQTPPPAPGAAAASGGALGSSAVLLGGLALVGVIVGAVALGSSHRDSRPASA